MKMAFCFVMISNICCYHYSPRALFNTNSRTTESLKSHGSFFCPCALFSSNFESHSFGSSFHEIRRRSTKRLELSGVNEGKFDNKILNNLHCEMLQMLQGLVRATTTNSPELLALFHAVSKGETASVSALLQSGANVNATNVKGWTVLHISAAHGHTDIVRLLLRNGASVNAKNTEGRTALHCYLGVAGNEKGNIEIVRLLLNSGAGVNAVDNYGFAPIHYAVFKGDAASLSMLLEGGAVVDKNNMKRMTALHLSAAKGNTEIARLLLNSGASIHAKNSEGLTALHCYLGVVDNEKGNAEIVRLLLSSGASVNAKDDHGFAPIHRAVVKGDAASLSALLEGGADVDATDAQKRTALQLARLQNAKQCAKLLKAHVAKLGSKRFGKRANGLNTLISGEGSVLPRRRRAKAAIMTQTGPTDPAAASQSLSAVVDNGRTSEATTTQTEPKDPAAASQSPKSAVVDDGRTSEAFFNLLRAKIGLDVRTIQFSWVDTEQRFKLAELRVKADEEERRLQAALLEAAALTLDSARDQSLSSQDPLNTTINDSDGDLEGESGDEQNSSASIPINDEDGGLHGESDDEKNSSANMPTPGQPPVEVIELAPPAVKWLERANQQGRELLLSRLSRLMRGHRSYALSKRLQNTR